MDKFFLKSATIWGGIIAALPAMAAAFNLPISIGEVAGLDAAVGGFLDALQAVIGFVVLYWGRTRSDGGNLKLLPSLK